MKYPIKYAPAKRKNAIINGRLDFWQAGDSFTYAGSYISNVVDLWDVSASSSYTNISKQLFSDFQTEIVGFPKHYLRIDHSTTNLSTGYLYLFHKVENVLTFSGRPSVLSFYARSNEPKQITIRIGQRRGSSYPTQYINPQKFDLNTSWQRIEYKIELPNIVEYVQVNVNWLYLYIYMDAGSNYSTESDSLGNQSGLFDFACFQWEEGSSATEFEMPGMLEIKRINRYYWRGYADGNATGYMNCNFANNLMHGPTASFPTTMLRTPTMSIDVPPTYINCSSSSLMCDENGFVHILNTIAGSTRYRAYGGIYRAEVY